MMTKTTTGGRGSAAVLAAAAVLSLGACGGGSTAAGRATTPAATGSSTSPAGPVGTSTPVAVRTTTTTRTITPTVTRTATATRPATSPPTAAVTTRPADCDPAFTERSTTARTTDRGAPVTVETVRYRSACEDALGAGALNDALASSAAEERRDWSDENGSLSRKPDGDPGRFDWKVTTLVNTPELVVAQADEYAMLADAAHGADSRHNFVLLADTGSLVSNDAMIAELQRVIGTRRFAEQVRDAFGAADGTSTRATPADIEVYPTDRYLVATVDHCSVFACALGTVEVRMEWGQILPKGARISFLPDRYGW